MIGNHHNRAMDIAFLADRARRSGDSERAVALFRDALDLELEAISQISEPGGIGWAVLHRSAGWLALGCRRPDIAKRLAIKALAEEVDPGVSIELEQMLQQAFFDQHLESDGITLEEGEVSLKLVGRMVGAGFTLLSEFDTRATGFQTMIYRIVQRKLNLPYSGGVPTEIRNQFHAFISPPQVGSFAVSLRIGRVVNQQMAFPRLLGFAEVLSEFMDLMDMVGRSEMSEIEHRIPDPAYQRNFLGLAKKLAPDGDRISGVGFTSLSDGDVRSVSVNVPARALPTPLVEGLGQGGESFHLSGVLRYADAGARQQGRNQIKIVSEGEVPVDLVVPEGLLDDVVRPLWNTHVTARATRRRRSRVLVLQEIWESEPISGLELGPRISAAARSNRGEQPSLL